MPSYSCHFSVKRMQTSAMTITVPTVLLLLLGNTLAVAPGDEHDECPMPDYPPGIRVLMDSWRYTALLNPPTGVPPAVWLTENEEDNVNIWYSAGGSCQWGNVAVCLTDSRGSSWVFTQYINKNAPSPVSYPVRVFVNITYTFEQCHGSHCRDFEVLKYITNTENPQRRTSTRNYDDDIEPDSRINNDSTSSTASLHFDLSPTERGFYLALQERDDRTCVTVNRVLVYLHICPSVEVGLVHYPATPTKLSGSVMAMGMCTENAHHTELSRPNLLSCSSAGLWFNDQTLCECNQGYYRDSNDCESYIKPVKNPYIVTEEQSHVDVCFELAGGANALPLTLNLYVTTSDTTAVGDVDYLSVSTTIQMSLTDISTAVECVGIMIVNDDLSEEAEQFAVVMANGSDIFSQITVNIESSDGDNDCTEGSVTVVSDVLGSSLQLVEMCSSEGVWSPVCDNNWTLQDATVVCRELVQGSGPTVNQFRQRVGAPKQTFSAPECVGSETSLYNCSTSSHFDTTCHYILVHCSGSITPSILLRTALLLPTSTKQNLISVSISGDNGFYATTQRFPDEKPTSNVVQQRSSTVLRLPPLFRVNQKTSGGAVISGIIAGVAVVVLVMVVVLAVILLLVVVLYRKRKRCNVQKDAANSSNGERMYDAAVTAQENTYVNGRFLQNPLYDEAIDITPVQHASPSGQALQNPLYDEARVTVPASQKSFVFDNPIYDCTTPSERIYEELPLPNNRGTTNLPVPVDPNERGRVISPEYEVIDHTSHYSQQPPTKQASLALFPEAEDHDLTIPDSPNHEPLTEDDIPPEIPALEHEDGFVNFDESSSSVDVEENGREGRGTINIYGDEER